MVSKEISSVQHPIIKEWVSLRLERSARQESGSVLLLGEKMVREMAGRVEFKAVISTVAAPEIRAKERYLVTDSVMQKISGMGSTDGFAAIAPLPKTADVIGCRRLLILDRLADPGNLGTLLRSALALNWDGVIFTPGTVDPFNDKALRASKGALFFLRYAYKTAEEVAELPHTPYLADLDGTPLKKVKPEGAVALILSNEGAGAAPWAEKWARKIAIPMHNGVESLNVASSGAILLYELG